MVIEPRPPAGRPGRWGRHRGRFLWLAVALAACAAGEMVEPVLPAPHLLGPLLAGLAVAGAGFAAGHLPGRVNRTCQAVLGVLMGSYLNPHALHQASAEILPLTAVTAATVVLSLVAAAVFARVGRVDPASATLGMIAGGSAAVVSCAQDLDADPRLVAFLQYLRVALVAATAPMIVHWLFTSPATPGTIGPAPGVWSLVSGPDQRVGIPVLAVVALVGALLGRWVALPSPALLGPMLLTAVLTSTGLVGGFTPVGPLRALLFTVVGLDIGLRFTRSAVTRMRRLLPLALACVLTVSAACAALAWLLAATAHIPFSDAYLATTPGGINAVLATAVATHADVSLISSIQSLRLFTMVALAPLLLRVGAVRSTPRAPGADRADQ